jgi:hypothetical protein
MKNQRGQSIMQVLVSVGLLGIVMMAMASMMSSLYKENKVLTEKIAANDLKRVITSTLSTSACSLLVTKSGNVAAGSSLTFPAATFPVTINLNAIPASGTADVVSLTNPMASTLSNTLRIQTTNGIQLRILDATTAHLIVNFDPTSTIQQMRDLSFPLTYSSTVSGSNRTIDGCLSATAAAAASGLFVVVDQKAVGNEGAAAGGSGTADAWNIRALNTVRANTITGAGLASNRIRLPAGTYTIRASVPGWNIDEHQAKLYNVTDGTDTLFGTSEFAQDGREITTRSEIVGAFTINAPKDFEIRHIFDLGAGINSFGVRVGGGGSGTGGNVPGITFEVYTIVEIRKEQ